MKDLFYDWIAPAFCSMIMLGVFVLLCAVLYDYYNEIKDRY